METAWTRVSEHSPGAVEECQALKLQIRGQKCKTENCGWEQGSVGSGPGSAARDLRTTLCL